MYILADLFNPITEEDYKNKGVRLLPSRVSGEAATIQRVFDELSLDVLIPAVNGIVTTLNGLGIDGRVSSTDIKGIRLNSDNVIEITLNGSNWIAVSDPKGSVDNLNSNLTSYIDNVETRLEDKKANKTDVLSKGNEEIFEPVGQYNPATKKYVDDAVFNSGAADMTKAVYDTTGKNTDIFVYADEASKIADESGNTYRLAIDNNGLYLYPSELPNDKNYLPKESTLQDVLRINNGIDSKIGTSEDSRTDTVFGKLKDITKKCQKTVAIPSDNIKYKLLENANIRIDHTKGETTAKKIVLGIPKIQIPKGAFKVKINYSVKFNTSYSSNYFSVGLYTYGFDESNLTLTREIIDKQPVGTIINDSGGNITNSATIIYSGGNYVSGTDIVEQNVDGLAKICDGFCMELFLYVYASTSVENGYIIIKNVSICYDELEV